MVSLLPFLSGTLRRTNVCATDGELDHRRLERHKAFGKDCCKFLDDTPSSLTRVEERATHFPFLPAREQSKLWSKPKDFTSTLPNMLDATSITLEPPTISHSLAKPVGTRSISIYEIASMKYDAWVDCFEN